jgi:hypothetical protein
VGTVLLVAAVAAGAWLWTRPVVSPPRPAPGPTIVDTRVAATRAAGGSLRLRIAFPAYLTVETDTDVDGVTGTFGPERPVEKEPRDHPDPATTFSVAKGTSSRELLAFGPGLYVLRFDAEKPPPSWSVKVRVDERPAKGGEVEAPPK